MKRDLGHASHHMDDMDVGMSPGMMERHQLHPMQHGRGKMQGQFGGRLHPLPHHSYYSLHTGARPLMRPAGRRGMEEGEFDDEEEASRSSYGSEEMAGHSGRY